MQMKLEQNSSKITTEHKSAMLNAHLTDTNDIKIHATKTHWKVWNNIQTPGACLFMPNRYANI